MLIEISKFVQKKVREIVRMYFMSFFIPRIQLWGTFFIYIPELCFGLCEKGGCR